MTYPFAFLDQIWLTLLVLVPIVLVARLVVVGSRYSPILIVVVFGLGLGALMVASGAGTPGLADHDLLGMLGRATIIALAAAFFTGGQQLRRLFGQVEAPGTAPAAAQVTADATEVIPGTDRSQLFAILRAFFVLMGVEAAVRALMGTGGEKAAVLPLIAYLGLILAAITLDAGTRVADKRRFLGRGVLELAVLIAVLLAAALLARELRALAAFPPIFFAMLIAVGLGWVWHDWQHGPTLRALLFGGIPVVLAANFLIGGSLLLQALALEGMAPILVYGFFGQMLWMFGGISALMLFGRTAAVRNLAPGMAGALSHAGLTGACTAGDMGEIAQRRAPILIAVPFLGHVVLFTILAFSLEAGRMLLWPVALAGLAGVVISAYAFADLRRSAGDDPGEVDRREVRGLMLFAFGWQLVALFGGLFLLAGLPLDHAAMASSAALSHFGLFAALQGGLFGAEAASLIAVVFAMPFLVHPFVFVMFGRGMERGGEMPRAPAYVLAAIGAAGVAAGLLGLG